MSEESAPMGEIDGTLDDTQNDQGAGQEPKQDDYQARLDARLEEMSRAQQQQAEEFRQWRESLTAEPEADEDDQYPLEEGDDGFDEQEAQRFLDQLVQQRLQEHLAPLQRQQANEKRDAAFEQLKTSLPEFENDEVARKYIGLAVSDLEELNPAAIEDQRLVKWAEKLYKADKADERAAKETPPQRTPSLESGGGAAPQDTGEDAQDRLIRLAQDGGGW